jgi:hypothetical protein
VRRTGLFVILPAFLCGCSFLEVHSYYAPSAPAGEPREAVVSLCEGKEGFAMSGPPSRIVVTADGVVLGMEAGAYRVTTVAVGPLSVPVIPAFPPALFSNRELEVGDVLPIDFRILEPRDEVVDFSGASVQVFRSGEPVVIGASDAAGDPSPAAVDVDAEPPELNSFEAGEVEEELVSFKGWTPLWELSDGWTLPLPVGVGDPSPFRISVRGVLFRGEEVEFPDVEFSPARGWLVCEAQ